jgi:hypothetical protein
VKTHLEDGGTTVVVGMQNMPTEITALSITYYLIGKSCGETARYYHGLSAAA